MHLRILENKEIENYLWLSKNNCCRSCCKENRKKLQPGINILIIRLWGSCRVIRKLSQRRIRLFMLRQEENWIGSAFKKFIIRGQGKVKNRIRVLKIHNEFISLW